MQNLFPIELKEWRRGDELRATGRHERDNFRRRARQKCHQRDVQRQGAMGNRGDDVDRRPGHRLLLQFHLSGRE